MGNPIRSEEDAFRWLVGIGAYLGAIGVASRIGTDVALAVFLLETAALVGVYVMRKRRRASARRSSTESDVP